MPNIVYVNGTFVHNPDAYTHITDRGYQFADAAYEVVLFINKVGIDMDLHLDRLDRTLSELNIPQPMSRAALQINIETLLAKNHQKNGLVYIQVSRGICPRNHIYPNNIKPFMVMTTKNVSRETLVSQKYKRLSLTLTPDQRWKRCDLKTVGLLPNILAMRSAVDKRYDDALLYDEQGITEGTSWNFWIITKDGHLQTKPLDHTILWGITRRTILEIAKKHNINVIEKTITVSDLEHAQGAFVTSASKFVMGVHQIDHIYYKHQHPLIEELFDAYIDLFSKA